MVFRQLKKFPVTRTVVPPRYGQTNVTPTRRERAASLSRASSESSASSTATLRGDTASCVAGARYGALWGWSIALPIVVT